MPNTRSKTKPAIKWPKQVDEVEFAHRPQRENVFFEPATWPEKETARLIVESAQSRLKCKEIRRIAGIHIYDIFRFLNACQDLTYLFEAKDARTWIRRAGPNTRAVARAVLWMVNSELGDDQPQLPEEESAQQPQQTYWMMEQFTRDLFRQPNREYVLLWHVPGAPVHLEHSRNVVASAARRFVWQAMRRELGATLQIIAQPERASGGEKASEQKSRPHRWTHAMPLPRR